MSRHEIDEQDQFRCRLLVCFSSPCRLAGAEAVYDALVQAFREHGLDVDVEVATIGCTAHCADGPLVKACIPGREDVIYEQVTPEFALQILEKHTHGYGRKGLP